VPLVLKSNDYWKARLMAHRLSSSVDHYWPESISDFWKDSEGQVNRHSWNGELTRSPPKNFGGLKKGHQIRLDGLWDTTIEPQFNKADSNVPRVIKQLLSLDSKDRVESRPLQERLLGYTLTDDMRAILGEILASLIVRSPAFRNHKAITANFYRQGLPHRDSNGERNLIVANMNQDYQRIVQSLRTGGKIVVLFCDTTEFIFGDGFLNNISADSFSNQKLLIPMTPNMCVALSRPISYYSKPNTITVRLATEEVDMCNEITQIYTKDYVYYRNVRPKIVPEFSKRSFLELEYHRHPWLDNLLDEICRFRE
jgi:hypothetical protein